MQGSQGRACLVGLKNGEAASYEPESRNDWLTRYRACQALGSTPVGIISFSPYCILQMGKLRPKVDKWLT